MVCQMLFSHTAEPAGQLIVAVLPSGLSCQPNPAGTGAGIEHVCGENGLGGGGDGPNGLVDDPPPCSTQLPAGCHTLLLHVIVWPVVDGV